MPLLRDTHPFFLAPGTRLRFVSPSGRSLQEPAKCGIAFYEDSLGVDERHWARRHVRPDELLFRLAPLGWSVEPGSVLIVKRDDVARRLPPE